MFGGGRVEGQRRDGRKKKYAVMQDVFNMYLCIAFDCYCTTIVLPFQTASSS